MDNIWFYIKKEGFRREGCYLGTEYVLCGDVRLYSKHEAKPITFIPTKTYMFCISLLLFILFCKIETTTRRNCTDAIIGCCRAGK